MREDVTIDDFIDVIEGNRQYIKCLYVYNKIDTITIEEVDQLAHEKHSVVISCEWGLNLGMFLVAPLFTCSDFLVDKIWEYLDLVRVYTKKKGQPPSLQEPLILRNGSTVQDVCIMIHKDLVNKFKYAVVWVCLLPQIFCTHFIIGSLCKAFAATCRSHTFVER